MSDFGQLLQTAPLGIKAFFVSLLIAAILGVAVHPKMGMPRIYLLAVGWLIFLAAFVDLRV